MSTLATYDEPYNIRTHKKRSNNSRAVGRGSVLERLDFF